MNAFGWFIMGFDYGLVAGALMFWLILILAKRERKRHKQRVDDYDLDATECEKHHLPGDCPLCGAE